MKILEITDSGLKPDVESVNHYRDGNGLYSTQLKGILEQSLKLGVSTQLSFEVVRVANLLHDEYLHGNLQIVNYDLNKKYIPCTHCSGTGYLDFYGDFICPNCCGSGDEEYDEIEKKIDPKWSKYFKLLKYALGNELGVTNPIVEEVMSLVLKLKDGDKDFFSDKNLHVYDLLLDSAVRYYFLNEYNKDGLPDWYLADFNLGSEIVIGLTANVNNKRYFVVTEVLKDNCIRLSEMRVCDWMFVNPIIRGIVLPEAVMRNYVNLVNGKFWRPKGEIYSLRTGGYWMANDSEKNKLRIYF